MSLRDLIVSDRPHRHMTKRRGHHPFDFFGRDAGHWIDNFFEDFGMLPFSKSRRSDRNSFLPKIDLREDDDKIEVTAELPGMDEKDIKVTLKDQLLSIKGEKKSKTENKKNDYHHIERSFGSFERTIRLGPNFDSEKIKAEYKNGVLTVTLPKTESEQKQVRQIEVQGS